MSRSVVASPEATGWPSVLSHFDPAALEASARSSGALRRRRGVRSAAALLRLALGYGPGGLSLRQAAAWAELHGIADLSDVALLNRLRHAAAWFGELAGGLVAEGASVASAAAAGQRPIRIVDGTAVRGPGSRTTDWRLHVAYDPGAQRFTHIALAAACEAERLERAPVAPEEIRLADRNFARPAGIQALTAGAGDYVVRVGWRGLYWLDPDGAPFAMLPFLDGIGAGGIGEAPVLIGRARAAKDGWVPVPARLVAVRLPPAAAAASRRRARKASRKGGNRLQPGTLKAAGYLLLLTSLDAAAYPAERIAALYRLRWQVELAFKRLKSLLRVDRLPAKDPDLARAWLFAHLITALLIDSMVQDVLDFPP